MSGVRPGFRAHWDTHGPAPGSMQEAMAKNAQAVQALARAVAATLPTAQAALGAAIRQGVSATKAATEMNRILKALAKHPPSHSLTSTSNRSTDAP